MSRSRGDTSLMIRPSIAIRPDVTFSSPATIRSAVVFPHPDGPTRMRNSASPTVSERSSTAATLPSNSFVTWSNLTSAIALSLQPGGGDAPNEVPLRREEQREHWDHAHDVPGHDQRPKFEMRSLEHREAQLEREVPWREDGDERPQEIVPRPHELDHGQGGQGRERERQHDLEQDAEARGAVDPGRLLQLHRQRAEE